MVSRVLLVGAVAVLTLVVGSSSVESLWMPWPEEFGTQFYLGKTLHKATTNGGATSLDLQVTPLMQGTKVGFRQSLHYVEGFNSLHQYNVDLNPRVGEAEIMHSHPKHHVEISLPAASPGDVQGHQSRTEVNLQGADYDAWVAQGRPMPGSADSNQCRTLPEFQAGFCDVKLTSWTFADVPGAYTVLYEVTADLGVVRLKFYADKLNSPCWDWWCNPDGCTGPNGACWTISPQSRVEPGQYELVVV